MTYLGKSMCNQVLERLEYLKMGVAMTDVLDGVRDPDHEVELCCITLRVVSALYSPVMWITAGFVFGIVTTVGALIVWAALS